ncbi:hypothetical protein [Muricoccus radiodurans]|uniref:hypothetical protein n=1 Tax=Muricoccus radiodurans TaxID=2231721 RepID=UPI003CE99014
MLDKATPPPECESFSIAGLSFSFAWSRLAPGIDGWRVQLVQIASGEMLDVTPPGSEFPVFSILPRAGYIEVIRERPIDAGGGQISIGRFRGLREAVLALCSLDDEQIAQIDRDLVQLAPPDLRNADEFDHR